MFRPLFSEGFHFALVGSGNILFLVFKVENIFVYRFLLIPPSRYLASSLS
jgi:hypothetical protein